jgi:hypothetical protein
MSKPKFTGTRSNQGNSNGSWLKPGGGSQLRGRPDSKLRGAGAEHPDILDIQTEFASWTE